MCEAVVSILTCRTDVLESIHSSLRCTLLRRLVQAASVLFFVPLSSNSRRVRPHIGFRRCTSSVGDVPPSVLTLLVGDTARSYGIHLLVPSPLLHVYDVIDHAFPSSYVGYWSSLSGLTVLASVTLDSDDTSSSPVAVVIFIVWQCSVLYRFTYRHLNTILVFIIIIIVAIIVFALHCFDIICLLLLLQSINQSLITKGPSGHLQCYVHNR